MATQYGPPSLPGGHFNQAFMHPAIAKPLPAKKKPAPVSQTLSQAANQRVNAQLNPQIGAQNAFNQQQNSVIQNFAQALLGKLQPIAGQVGAGYDQAIQQQGALSGQAAQFLQNANPSGKVAELLQQAGAPQSQQNQITSQLGQTFGGGAGVLAFTGGAIPGGQLAADKASAVGEAAQLPGFAALKGQQDLASALWQQGQDRRTLEATRPALYQAAAQDIRQNNAARAKYAQTARQDLIGNRFKADTINERAHEFDVTTKQKADQFASTQDAKKAAADFLQWYRTQGLHQAEAKINQKAAQFGVTAAQKDKTIAVAQQNANTSAVRANNSAAAAAKRQATANARLTLAQRHEQAYEKNQAAKLAKSAKTKGISATSYANLRKQAVKQADLFYYGKTPKQHYNTQKGAYEEVPGTGVPGIDYPVAVKRLMDGYSLTKTDAQAILNDFYAPGEAGRPKNQAQKKVASVVNSAAAAALKGLSA